MELLRTAVAAVAAAGLLAGAAAAVTPMSPKQLAAANQLSFSKAWSRPALQGKVGVAYLTIRNAGPRPITLMGAHSDVAERVELHRSSMAANGTMSMAEVERLPIPVKGAVVMAPGGYHLMLIGLKQPLTAGAKVPVILHVYEAGGILVQVEVRTSAPG